MRRERSAPRRGRRERRGPQERGREHPGCLKGRIAVDGRRRASRRLFVRSVGRSFPRSVVRSVGVSGRLVGRVAFVSVTDPGPATLRLTLELNEIDLIPC